MATATENQTIAKDIRALLDEWVTATQAMDLDRIMACYSPDVVAFDAIGRLQFKGREAYRNHWQMVLGFMNGPMTFEMRELDVTGAEDIAFCHYVAWCGMENDKGEKEGGWVRATVCCARQNDAWRIVHEHYSVPFDPETNKIVADLTP